LSTGDFDPAFRQLLGEKAPLSASTIVRLKATWADEYAAWGAARSTCPTSSPE
jgi:hypothetical protein